MARAQAVRAVLVREGVPETIIETRSLGEEPPQMVRTRNNVTEPRNRAVEVRFHAVKRTFGLRTPSLRPGPAGLTGTGGGRSSPETPGDTGGLTLTHPAPALSVEEALLGFVQSGKQPENERRHFGLDLTSGVTANAPTGISPTTYGVTAVVRNLHLRVLGDKDSWTALDLFHEPNFSIVLSPEPANQQVYTAAISVLNWHLRSHGDDFVELSLSVLGSSGRPSNTTTIGAQLQVELHLTSRYSVTLSTSIGTSPTDPKAAPDYGGVPLGQSLGWDWNWQPINVGVLYHTDSFFGGGSGSR
jgi:hypothetical protein